MPYPSLCIWFFLSLATDGLSLQHGSWFPPSQEDFSQDGMHSNLERAIRRDSITLLQGPILVEYGCGLHRHVVGTSRWRLLALTQRPAATPSLEANGIFYSANGHLATIATFEWLFLYPRGGKPWNNTLRLLSSCFLSASVVKTLTKSNVGEENTGHIFQVRVHH